MKDQTYNPQTDPFFSIVVDSDLVTLPSKGIFYDEGTTEVMVEHMVGSDEAILSNFGDDYNDFRLLNKKVKETTTPIEQMLSGDIDKLMWYLGISSYGTKLNAVVTCPDKGEKFDWVIDLNEDLNEKPLNLENFNPVSKTFKFVSPVSKFEFEFKLLPLGKEREIIKSLEASRKSLGANYGTDLTNNQHVVLHRIVEITNPNGDKTKDKKAIENVIKKLNRRDIWELEQYMALVEPGIARDVKVKSPFTQKEFFRPIRGIRSLLLYPTLLEKFEL